MLANMIKSTYSFKIPKSGKLIPLLYIYIYIYKRLEYNAVTFNFFLFMLSPLLLKYSCNKVQIFCLL